MERMRALAGHYFRSRRQSQYAKALKDLFANLFNWHLLSTCNLANSELISGISRMWKTNSRYPQGFHSQLGKINAKWH